MNLEGVNERFLLFSGIESSELPRWQPVIEDACRAISARCIVPSPDEEQQKRLEALAAAYAFRLFSRCGGEQISSFTAGDVHITSSAGAEDKGEALWKSLCEDSTDLLKSGSGFFFERIVME